MGASLNKQVTCAALSAESAPAAHASPQCPMGSCCNDGAQLWAAARAGETAEVSRLVAAGAQIDSHDPDDVSLLARRVRRLSLAP
jgi:hypothetical protein